VLFGAREVVDTLEPSPELVAITRRRFAAWNARDVETFLNFCANEPWSVFIGSDPDEWWSGSETFRKIIAEQLPEFEEADVTADVGEAVAFSEGTVGWVACRVTLVRPDGTTVPMRFSGVLYLDHGMWRFVHAHFSQGVANEESFGRALTTTVEHLAAAARVEQPDLTATAAEDGTVTVAFSDIENSTEVAVRLGDHKWFELLRWHDSVVTDCTTRQGGRVVKSLGDGHMLAFSSASRALHGSIEIQRSLQDAHDDEHLRVRIGLHTGEALRHADDFFGNAVITAARVAAAADGNEILVSSLVHELTRSLGTFEFGEPRSVQFKGLPGDHNVFPVTWDDARGRSPVGYHR
jgi:class 3 adenylate cyclase